jgi:nitrogenase subunit NifH
LVEQETEDITLEALPFDFIYLSKSHMDMYLANTVCSVMKKFHIQDKICGIMSNNSKNNEFMVRELQKLKGP